ncbi:hypothetical protein TNCV_562611 [Trichonephila clavipes]|nr:hypothetical protein TNCV_562611 [Trichonephila clavipes]
MEESNIPDYSSFTFFSTTRRHVLRSPTLAYGVDGLFPTVKPSMQMDLSWFLAVSSLSAGKIVTLKEIILGDKYRDILAN